MSPEAPAPAAPATPAGMDLRRLHPATPFIRGWRVVAVLLAAVGQDALRHASLGQFAASAAVVVPLAAGYGALSWWFTRFRIEEGDLRLETGVLFRRTRHVRLDRLQAVDVVRPLLARFGGLAELRLEVAGGEGAEARLAYVAESEARTLRAELLARAAGVAPDTAEAPEQHLVTVPTSALLMSMVMSTPAVLSVVVAVTMVGLGLVIGAPGLAFLLVPEALALAGLAFNQFAAGFDFTVAESPDGLRLRHGLLEHRSQTVPPGRVQSIRVVQPWLWRMRGWVKVQVNIAGYAGGNNSESQRSAELLPVAPRQLALAVIERALPGVDLDAVPLEPVPGRARWLRPFTWRALACGAGPDVFVSRRGRLRRELDVIPHGKIQSVRMFQGPLQRRLGLATVHLDTTPGPVRVRAVHRSLADARRIVQAEAEQARHARRIAPPERWMTNLPP